jgi:hypothetical protein
MTDTGPIDRSDDLPLPGGAGGGAPRLAAESAAIEPGIVLSFADLLPDANGEIVIVGAGVRLSIVTDQRVADFGIADSHLTADGFDVGGLSYFMFEGGTKLYYSPEVDVTITTA